MSWVATPVRKRSASNSEARIGNMSLVPTPLEVNRSRSGGSPSPQSPILSQLTENIDGLREFHLEKLRLHREIDDTLGCYAGLARHGSKTSSILPRVTDQVLGLAPIATRATSCRKRAATSLCNLELDSPSKGLDAGNEKYLNPEILETVDKDFMRWARREGISDIVRSTSNCWSSLEVTRLAPSDQMTFGLQALDDYRLTYPEKP